MPAVPEFILRKLFVQGSLQAHEDGFSFVLNNTFAPATVIGFGLEVDGITVPAESLSVQKEGSEPQPVSDFNHENPFAFSVGMHYTVRVQEAYSGKGRLTILVDTVEAGLLKFTLQAQKEQARQPSGGSRDWLRRLLGPWHDRPLKAQVRVDAQALIGEAHPYIFGQFIEHLERCVYGGVWTQDGAHLRPDTLALIKALKPPLIRYPGGNFASGYHWEDGVGPKKGRPRRFDKAWNAWENNQVGTDEFMEFCRQVGAEPFLVVNDGSGTPEEAARWVAYCNHGPESEQGSRRKANAQSEPYNVRVWGVGNEVWGEWQIGHTGSQEYATRLRKFVEAMRAADPEVRIVAVGDGVLTDAPEDPGLLWNEAVLRQVGDMIDDLSFHLYQPGREGWQESYDPENLHHTVCAAPRDVERIIERIAKQIDALEPGKKIGIAFDEWNLWLPPPEGSESMHQVIYTQRDALYVAGMLNAFQRQCNRLSMANLAQLVNVLPLIITNDSRAVPTSLYGPFWMYQNMQPFALQVEIDVETFDSDKLGNIAAQYKVPYLDVSATRSQDGKRLALGIVNCHPSRSIRTSFMLSGFERLRGKWAWLQSAKHPLAANSVEAPDIVRVREIEPAEGKAGRVNLNIPACAVMVQVFESAV